MERENGLLYSETKNPIYQALENQLRLEFEWAYADKNLYSISWIALHLKTLSDEEFRKLETLLNQDLKKIEERKLSSFLNTEFILGLCFAAEIFHRKRRVPNELVDSLNSILREVGKRNWLNSHEFASLILRSLSNINEYNKIVRIVFLWVMDKYREFVRNQDYEKAIDCLYGLETMQKDLQLSEDILLEMAKQVDRISDEILAKLCVILKNESKEYTVKFVRELERRLKEEFKGSLGPSLERGLREIISLMNSACPQETIKSIIDVKRKEGQSWAEDISTEDRNIIIKRIPELGELPKINPKFHALALKALDIHNRSSAIMLNKNDFLKMKEVFNTSKKDYLGVRKKEYQIILLMAGITSFFAFILLPEIVSKIFTLDYQYVIVFIQEYIQDPIKIIRDGWIPGVLLWLWVWFIRVLYLLRRGGEISILRLIKLMPILGYLIKELLSTEGDSKSG